LQPQRIPETACAAPVATNPDGDALLGSGTSAPTSGMTSHLDSGNIGPRASTPATSAPVPEPSPTDQQVSAPALLSTPIKAATSVPAPDNAPTSTVVQSAPESSSVTAPPPASSNSALCTWLQDGIQKPKVYTDGIVRYANLASVEEPGDLSTALQDLNW
jgi:hypothetical protein